MSLSVSVPLTNVHDHRLFPWLWPGPRAEIFDLIPDQQARRSISPLSPATLASSLTKWAKSGVTQQCRPGGPVHCMRAKATPGRVFYFSHSFDGFSDSLWGPAVSTLWLLAITWPLGPVHCMRVEGQTKRCRRGCREKYQVHELEFCGSS